MPSSDESVLEEESVESVDDVELEEDEDEESLLLDDESSLESLTAE